MRLDLAVTDLDAAVAGAERSGARLACCNLRPIGAAMLDPASLPFCLTAQIPTEAG